MLTTDAAQHLNESYLFKLVLNHLERRDNTLDDNLKPPRMLLVKNNAAQTMPVRGLGDFDQLPVELLLQALRNIDLESLTKFCLVNRKAFQIARSLPEYRTLIDKAPHVVPSIMAVKAGQWVTCESIYRTLCTSECECCGRFGEYMYILTCTRVCFRCLTQNESFLPLSLNETGRKYGLKIKVLRSLPHIRNVMGTYSPGKFQVCHQSTLADPALARQTAITIHGSIGAMQAHVAKEEVRRDQALQKRIDKDKADCTGNRVYHFRARAGGRGDRKANDVYRFVGVVHLPAFDKITQKIDYGVFCKACRGSKGAWEFNQRQKYGADSFREHILEYGDIEDGKHRDMIYY